MRLIAAFATVLCLAAAPALAQDAAADKAAPAASTSNPAAPELTPAQRQAVYKSLARRHKLRRRRLHVRVGSRLPRSVRLYPVPRQAATEPVRRYRYTLAGDRVVLADPDTRTIVLIIGVGF
jgi:hypothetical protein